MVALPARLKTWRRMLWVRGARLRARMRRALSTLRHKTRVFFWTRFYRYTSHASAFASSHRIILIGVIWAVLVLASFVGKSKLQTALAPFFSTPADIQKLQAFYLALGGALIGATAIVSSFVMFALQVNVERTPHGLFKRLSEDPRLIGAFTAAFLLAVGVAGLSLSSSSSTAALHCLLAFWITATVLGLFLFAYRRALFLINPIRQLNLALSETTRELRRNASRSRRIATLTKTVPVNRGLRNRSRDDSFHFDSSVAAIYSAFPAWTDGAKRMVRYAISFATRYAEQRDHDVSAAALQALVVINKEYILQKGRTFFSENFLIDNPFVTDGFVNETLEQLRQLARSAVSRADEEQITQTFRAFASLAQVYLTIDYERAGASKTHAHLATGYLIGEVERLIQHDMPDVLMEGVRLIGRTGVATLSAEGPQGISSVTEKLGIIGCGAILKVDHRPVTLTVVEQLADLSLSLLLTKASDIGFAAARLRQSIKAIATVFLAVPDAPLVSAHSANLAPYYSLTTTRSLASRLAQLANQLSNAASEDKAARRIIRNIEEWADEMYSTDKELLLAAIKARSHLAFDLIHWITHITSVLLAISNAKCCPEHDREELRKHASWVISVLSFVPHDKESAAFIENFQLTDALFESAVDALNRDCGEVSERIGTILFTWTFGAGKHEIGWAILQRGICGLAALALLDKTGISTVELKSKVTKQLANGRYAYQLQLDRTAKEIRRLASRPHDRSYHHSQIDHAMARADQGKLQQLLTELADLLSNTTGGQELPDDAVV